MGVHGIDPDRQQNEHDADDGKERDLLIQYDDAADHGRYRLDEGSEGGLRCAGPGPILSSRKLSEVMTAAPKA